MNHIIIEKIKSTIIFLQHWGHENFSDFYGIEQLGVIVIAYLLAVLFKKKVYLYLENIINYSDHSYQVDVVPRRFSRIIHYIFLLMLLWFCQSLFDINDIPTGLFKVTQNIVLAVIFVYYAFAYIKSNFWSYTISIMALFFTALKLTGFHGETVKLMEGMSLSLGQIRLSVLDCSKGLFALIILYSIASFSNRFFAFLLLNYSHLNTSDRILIERVVRFTTFSLVFLITLVALGINPTAVVAASSAFALAIGIGLQKIGSNLVSGITLLIRKPITVGDLLLLKTDSGKSLYTGRINSMGLLYVHFTTRDGTEEFIPNDYFLTNKIKSISYLDDLYRLHVRFGISYKSNLKKAMALAVDAAKKVDRVMTTPTPVCLMMNLGDSNVDLELRAWIKDPSDGITNAKSSVLIAVWDIFHANNVEFAFPQRDLHFKDALPIILSKET